MRFFQHLSTCSLAMLFFATHAFAQIIAAPPPKMEVMLSGSANPTSKGLGLNPDAHKQVSPYFVKGYVHCTPAQVCEIQYFYIVQTQDGRDLFCGANAFTTPEPSDNISLAGEAPAERSAKGFFTMPERTPPYTSRSVTVTRPDEALVPAAEPQHSDYVTVVGCIVRVLTEGRVVAIVGTGQDFLLFARNHPVYLDKVLSAYSAQVTVKH